MIRHGVHKKLVEIFVENVSDQLFFAIFVDAEGIGPGRKLLLDIFEEFAVNLFAECDISVPGRKNRTVHVHIHNIRRICQPYRFEHGLGKNLLIDGDQGVTDHTAFAVLLIAPSSKDQDISVAVGVHICPYILIFLAQPIEEHIHIILIETVIAKVIKNISVGIIYRDIFGLCRIDDLGTDHALDLIDRLIFLYI